MIYRQNALVVRPKTTRWWFWDHLFARFRWYRRMCGGHWECWYIEQVWARIWMQREEHGIRPPLGYGNPICEDWCNSKG